MNLIRIPANEDCPAGGVLVQSGLDKNQNDILDSAEIDQAETSATELLAEDRGLIPALTGLSKSLFN